MSEVLDGFHTEYKKLKESEQEKFAVLVNKLLTVNYLTGEKEEDLKNYYFILEHFNCFKDYLLLSGIELSLYKQNKIVVLSSENIAKLSLTKLQSAVLLIIRLLYNQKFTELTLSNKVVITQLDIRNLYEQIGIQGEEKLTTTKLAECLVIFKKYNLINYKGRNFQADDFSITIYSTIQYAVDINTIEELINKINSYKEGGISDEEISED